MGDFFCYQPNKVWILFKIIPKILEETWTVRHNIDDSPSELTSGMDVFCYNNCSGLNLTTCTPLVEVTDSNPGYGSISWKVSSFFWHFFKSFIWRRRMLQPKRIHGCGQQRRSISIILKYSRYISMCLSLPTRSANCQVLLCSSLGALVSLVTLSPSLFS